MAQAIDNVSTPLPAEKTGETAVYRILALSIGRHLLFSAVVLLAILYVVHLAFVAASQAGAAHGVAWWLLEAGRQTIVYLGQLLQGQLGMTQPRTVAFNPMPVAEALPVLVSHSFGLLGVTFLLSAAVGVPLGVWAAVQRQGRGSTLILIASFIGISTPSFFAALFLQILAIQYTRTFGTSLLPVGGFGWDSHLILPMLVLAARPVAQITRVTYVSISDILDQDYIRVARSKGLRGYQVLLIHTMRNAAVPILTTVLVSLRFSLSSLPVVEFYFGWNGMGDTLLAALFTGDVNLSAALLLTLGILFLFINLILETSYALIDPRLRQKGEQTQREGSFSLLGMGRGLWEETRRFLVENPLSQWIGRRIRPQPETASPFRPILQRRGMLEEQAEAQSRGRVPWRTWRRVTLGNPALLIGLLIVGGLVYLMLFGPQLAPMSPNTTQPVATIDGEIATPPFPPSERHPWGTDPLGRDVLSLVLAGTQQTLLLAFAVVGIRLIIGFVAGVAAGWFQGSWLDRGLTALVQAMAVFPTLLLAALLIFIIGIQGGMRTFLIALSLVGWGEIMQLVRGEVISLQQRPFIESAVAVGQRAGRLILIHILPNLAPTLIAVAALEVGAVLLILGELGFLGIFISGGAGSDFGLYAQVPEWGSLLSNVRDYARAYPWTAFYPMAAFFIAILGFNLLSEGLRRLVDEIGLAVNRLVNRYTLALAVLAVAGVFWAQNNTGQIVFYRQQAEDFSGARAMTHVEALIGEEMNGRPLGAPGADNAAAYIAGQYREMGLQAAGAGMSYLQPVTRTYQALTGTPTLTLGEGETAEYRDEFALYPSPTQNRGEAQGAVRLLAFGPETDLSALSGTAGQIILIPEEAMLSRLAEIECRGVLIVARDATEIRRRYTYSAQPPAPGCGQSTPALLVSERLANRLLDETDLSMFSLGERLEELGAAEMIEAETGATVAIEIPAEIKTVEAVNVIGHLPGTSADLDSQVILVAAQYDSPALGVAEPLPGVSDNAAGVAVMLEAIQTMQTSGYQPFKTFLFVAYSGEGLPGGAAMPDPNRFLQGRSTFANAFQVEAVIYLRGLGGGSHTLDVWTTEAGAQSDLAKLLETTAHLNDVETRRARGLPAMSIYLPATDTAVPDIGAPQVGLSMQGWERNARLSSDSLQFLSQEGLTEAGRSLSLGLMILGREQDY